MNCAFQKRNKTNLLQYPDTGQYNATVLWCITQLLIIIPIFFSWYILHATTVLYYCKIQSYTYTENILITKQFVKSMYNGKIKLVFPVPKKKGKPSKAFRNCRVTVLQEDTQLKQTFCYILWCTPLGTDQSIA